MNRQSYLSLSAFLMMTISASVYAQTPTPTKNKSDKASVVDKDKAAREEAKRIEEQRRATALSLLTSLADEARSFRDLTSRARIQARAADILWESDTEKARMMFRRAWDAADVADTESQRRFDEERRAREQSGKPFSGVTPHNLRTEVLRMAAKRDRKLGEELLAKIEDARKQDAANATTEQTDFSRNADPFELPSALKLRLRLAQQLLETDVTRALEFADPALGRVSVDGLVFLCYLRVKNTEQADARYGNLLAISGGDGGSDSNTISLLSSYLFTPFVFIRIDANGGTNRNQYNNASPPPEVSTGLRSAFFRVAEQIFLRPLAPPEQDQTTSGRMGKYLIMKHLLPYFEQYGNEQSTTLLKAQITALAREIPEGNERRDEEVSESSDSPSRESGSDSIQSLLAQIERAPNQEERDQLYARVALLASEKDDPRAFDFADKIEDGDTRKSVRAYVDFNATRTAIEKKRMDDALKLARTGSLSNLQRVWVLTQIASSFAKTDRERSIELLEEAAVEARRIGGSSADRARGLVGVSSILYEVSRGPSWELMSEVARVANNSTEQFTGEDARVLSSIQTKSQTSMLSFTVDEMDLSGIFRKFAKEDLQRAILLAKDFNGESPRATALIAIIRSVLESKPAPEKRD